MIERMLPYVTVFNGRPEVNILDAAPLVLAALPGMTPEGLQSVLSERDARRENPNSVMALLDPNVKMATVNGSKAVRLTIEIGFGDGRRTSFEVVILVVEGSDEPYRVLSWRDAADGIPGPSGLVAGRP